MSLSEAKSEIRALLDRRGPHKTICPSEAARKLADGDEDWRDKMDVVHQAVDALNAEGEIAISRKGESLDQRRGAYRIARR